MLEAWAFDSLPFALDLPSNATGRYGRYGPVVDAFVPFLNFFIFIFTSSGILPESLKGHLCSATLSLPTFFYFNRLG